MRSKKRISKKVFKELAAKNVKKSAKDYFIYFFTLTFAVCLFYTFNSIKDQFEILGIPDTFNYLAASQGAIAAVSVVSCMIIGFLVSYANRFLMKRRKKEFGVYFTLGMDRRDVGRLLMKETMKIGSAALLSGLLLGIGTSQVLSMITARISGAGLGSYSFIFSFGAAVAAVIFFGLTFAFVHFFNVRELKKMELIDLLYADRKNEEVPESAHILPVRNKISGSPDSRCCPGGSRHSPVFYISSRHCRRYHEEEKGVLLQKAAYL